MRERTDVRGQGLERCPGVLSGLLLLLAGCASTGPAPVRDLGLGGEAPEVARETTSAPQVAPGHHRVQRGDTLYSIAFRNGLDYRDIAAWNGIAAPYTIRVGEDLRLTAPAARAVASTASPASTPAPESPPASVPTPAPFQPVAPAAAATSVASVPAGNSDASGMATATTPGAAEAPIVQPASPPPRPPPAEPVPERTASGEPVWRWPAEGKLVGTFAAGDPVRQGIDIAGQAGDPVRAAAAGTVVYSGNGLIGYGELIIIKHDSTWLSAYGHNRKRLVQEGQRVAAGDVIAEMGASSASRNALHFEVRRKGKPVNPLDHLPRR